MIEKVFICLRSVREHIPLEQGLRHAKQSSIAGKAPVREHIPLEQGLRQAFGFKGLKNNRQRAYSIRTRIKTRCGRLTLLFYLSESIFH